MLLGRSKARRSVTSKTYCVCKKAKEHSNVFRLRYSGFQHHWQNRIIANEEARRVKRLDPHYNNPVWENRAEPPPDWNAPLPPFLAEKQKDTFLEIKAREIREGKAVSEVKTCVIM